MKTRMSLIAVGLLGLACEMCAGAPAGGWQPGPSDKWFVKFDDALADAKARTRPLFVLNTGSTWCHWCKKLRSEVLDTDAFNEFADKNLTLLYLDSPCENDDQKKHNKNVAKALKFGGGVPNVRLFDQKGRFLGSVGGGGLAVEAYLGKLREILEKQPKDALEEKGRLLFSEGYAVLEKRIAEERAALPKVAKTDFKAKLVGVAVVPGKQRWNKNADFRPPSTRLVVPFGKVALFKVEYDFPDGYEAKVWTRGMWPAGERRNSYYFGSNPSGLYKGSGVTTGFLSLRERGKTCNLKTLVIRTNSEPELDDEPNGWEIGTFPVDIEFQAKDPDGEVAEEKVEALFTDEEIAQQRKMKPDAAVKQTFARLFPKWNVSGSNRKPYGDDEWAYVGYFKRYCDRYNVCSTFPLNASTKICISQTVALPKGNPSLELSFNCPGDASVGGGFAVRVRVNGAEAGKFEASDATWQDQSIDLSKWAGKKVKIEIQQIPKRTTKFWRACWSKIEVTLLPRAQ